MLLFSLLHFKNLSRVFRSSCVCVCVGPSSSGYTGLGMTFVGDNFECFLSMMTFETGFKFAMAHKVGVICV